MKEETRLSQSLISLTGLFSLGGLTVVLEFLTVYSVLTTVSPVLLSALNFTGDIFLCFLFN